MYTDPSITDFKAQFYRDFPYQPPLNPGSPEVPADPGDPDAVPPIPATPEIPAVPADVPDLGLVQDEDIQVALDDAKLELNAGLCPSQAFYTKAFLLLAAHKLVMNLRASSQGLAGKFSWLEGSKGVGSVSTSSAIPQRILDNPAFAFLSASSYGVSYLILILPRLSGQIFTVAGITKP